MMISQPALMCLEATWRRLTERRASVTATDTAIEHVPNLPPFADLPDLSSALPVATMATSPEAGAIRGEASGPENALGDAAAIAPDSPLTADERRARAAALHGLTLSRGRRFDRAHLAFAEAARLDPMLDLTRIPGFWKLERAAHEAAIEAYLDAGRERDAAVLRAQVRSTYRPKPLRPRAGAALST